jgi:hypothetical protein
MTDRPAISFTFFSFDSSVVKERLASKFNGGNIISGVWTVRSVSSGGNYLVSEEFPTVYGYIL